MLLITLAIYRKFKVPALPNGPSKYKVEYNQKDPLAPVSDNWNWGRTQPCNRKGFCNGGRRTLQICKGSLECCNSQCIYKKIHRETNKVDFTMSKKCIHCKANALPIECCARKYVEHDRCHKDMTVVYIGTHNCSPRTQEKKPEKEKLEDYLKTRPTSTTKQIQVEKIREAMLSGKGVKEIEDVADEYSTLNLLLTTKSCQADLTWRQYVYLRMTS